MDTIDASIINIINRIRMGSSMMNSNEKKVIVLMSTYNGEKYLREQIDSILNQTYKNIQLFIRDDNSKDTTPSILKEYENDPRVKIELSNINLGYPECFYYLTNHVGDADYYAFSDQDDVWYPDKIERAVSKLEASGFEGPISYYGEYDLCDENLYIINSHRKNIENLTLEKSLYEVVGLEFTQVINKEALLILNRNKPIQSKARGTWMSMLYSSSISHVIHDNFSCAKYRRHSNAVTNDNMSTLGQFIWRVKKFLGNDALSGYVKMINEFNDIVGPLLSDEEKRILNLFGNKGHRFKKIFYPKKLRSASFDEFSVRMMFLIGKL